MVKLSKVVLKRKKGKKKHTQASPDHAAEQVAKNPTKASPDHVAARVVKKPKPSPEHATARVVKTLQLV